MLTAPLSYLTYILEARLLGYALESSGVAVQAGHGRHHDFYLRQQAIDLDGVVISANRHETMRRSAPSLVTVLSQEIFQKTHSDNLSQGLRFQPGLRIEDNCQNCGFNQVRINGLEGAYSQILIDSRPVFSALAGVYGLEQIPSSPQLHQLRGCGSPLYFADAYHELQRRSRHRGSPSSSDGLRPALPQRDGRHRWR